MRACERRLDFEPESRGALRKTGGTVLPDLPGRKLQAKEGRVLKVIRGAVLILFGLVMLYWPEVVELT